MSLASTAHICDICRDVKTKQERPAASNCRLYGVTNGPSIEGLCIFLTGVLYVKTE